MVVFSIKHLNSWNVNIGQRGPRSFELNLTGSLGPRHCLILPSPGKESSRYCRLSMDPVLVLSDDVW